jgi:hypothetical protein
MESETAFAVCIMTFSAQEWIGNYVFGQNI